MPPIYSYVHFIVDLQRLEEHITKNSPSLSRDAIYKKSVSNCMEIKEKL